MASSKAQIAKNKGNASFKSGNWADAVGHYTAAILADRTEPTYPLNRAAAYLKLGKYRDAERDCTTVLSLDGKNVKALFRRAQAGIALNNLAEAEKDLLDGLKIEPNNTSLKTELTTVKSRQLEALNIRTSKREPISIPPPPSFSQSSDASKPQTVSLPLRRITRNVPIEIIEPAEPGSTDFLKPVQSRVLSTPPSRNSPTPSTSVPKSQSRVGGGVFRADGKHTILRSPSSETIPSLVSASLSSPGSAQLNNPTTNVSALSNVTFNSNGSSPPPPPPPLTLFALTRAWNALSTSQDRYSLLLGVSPESLPALFQDSLEPEFLVSMLRTFKAVVSPSTSANLIRFMYVLPSTPRFNTVLLFLSQKEKHLLSEVWDAIDETQNNEGRHAWGL